MRRAKMLGLMAGAALMWMRYAGQGRHTDVTVAPVLTGIPTATALPPIVAPAYVSWASDLNQPLAPSLADTQVDGGIDTGPDGHLIVSMRLRRLFDYFLTATGEVPAAWIKQRIQAVIVASVGEPAAGEALDVLRRYLAWRQHAALQPLDDLTQSLQQRLDAIKSSRRQFFSVAEAEALWGEEERAADATLRRQTAEADPNLDASTRATQADAAEAQRPAEIRRSEVAATAILRYRKEEARLRAAGASAAELHAARVKALGEAAATRLRTLDSQRAQWQQRVADYLQARAPIVRDPALSFAERAAALDALRAARFQGPEALRVRTYENDSEAP